MRALTSIFCTSELQCFVCDFPYRFDMTQCFHRTMDDEYGLEEMCSNLIRDMNEYGVCVLDNFIGQEKGLRVLQEVKSMYSAGYFKEGQLVTSKDKTSNKNIRGDKIMWIDGKETGVSNVKFLMNQVTINIYDSAKNPATNLNYTTF